MRFSLPADVPVEVGRGEAQRAARQELGRRVYHADDPSLLERGLRWLLEKAGELVARAAEAAPGGYGGLLVLLVVLVLAVVAIRVRTGPLARSAASGQALFADRTTSAAEHRKSAEEHAVAGRWAEALRERLRALGRDLEQRGLVEARAGRTADELAAEAGRSLPTHAAGLRQAARDFDDVWYGGRPASPAMYAQVRDLDEQVRRTRPSAPGARPLVPGTRA